MRSEVQRLPKLFLERLRQMIPSTKWDAIANTFTAPRPTTFRVNPLKSSVAVVREKMEHQGFRLQAVPWYPDAFILKEGRLRDLQEKEIYQKGEIYVQGLSSMLPPFVLEPQAGETLLDLTAAPGSKTTQMACLMKGEGQIIANDNNPIRFFKLKSNVENQGAANVTLSMRHGESFGRERPNFFDRILLDAPCSAEGRFLTIEPTSYRFWKPAKIKEMVRKQKRLLFSAIQALRPGGVLVYSTCTFAPEENEGVLNWAIEKFGDEILLEDVGARPAALHHLPNRMPGLASWEGVSFHPSVRRAVRILPNNLMEGFFLARLSKKLA